MSEHTTIDYSQGEMGLWDASPSEFKAQIQTILRISVLALLLQFMRLQLNHHSIELRRMREQLPLKLPDSTEPEPLGSPGTSLTNL